MDKRLHLYYAGRVQGVGFRFTAERIATDLELTGWVKNLRDGRVEVIVEGKELHLNNFLEKIKDYFTDYIDDIELSCEEPSREFKDFRVKF